MTVPTESSLLRQVVLRDAVAARWLVFSGPCDVLVAGHVDEVAAVVEEACSRVRKDGLYAAGFVSYEASPAFDAAYVTQSSDDFPLACFGIFEAPAAVCELPAADPADESPAWRVDVGRDRYREKIAQIRDQIARGNTYQVNYTLRQLADGPVDGWRLFRDIAADAPQAAYVDGGRYAIVSASPELFFELDGDRLTCRPMKGTAARGMTTGEDDRIRAALAGSAKDRAENVMIADMVRNDLGRIALPGTVQATSLFDVEKYRTVWQMTSTITARTRASVSQVFYALFPSASITGAPKVASMRLIAALEDSPRHIYTGCIGFLAPERRARFNVAIRTAVIDRDRDTAVYGVGGGIVWDSDPDAEYQECLDKASVLGAGDGSRDFELLETLRWTPEGGFHLLEEHLQRLADSARYFDFRHDGPRVAEALAAFAGTLGDGAQRIRLRLDAAGDVTLEARALPGATNGKPLRVALAREPVDCRNAFLYHKTTRRAVYDRALAARGDCEDVLLWNSRGELTESTIANVVVKIAGTLYTPPVACGLLGGTMRRRLLETGEVTARVVGVDELPAADEIYLVNSVRGWRRALIAGSATATG